MHQMTNIIFQCLNISKINNWAMNYYKKRKQGKRDTHLC